MGPLRALEAQRGHLFPWTPVLLAIGVGVYFALPAEPPSWVFWATAGAALAAALIAWKGPELLGPVMVALGMLAFGFSLAGLRAQTVAAPKLEHRFYGTIEGRVVGLDRSLSDAPRLTLDELWLERVPPGGTPVRLRISLHADAGVTDPVPGTRVAMMAHLSPPSAPSEPGAFDFRRYAWFEQLGAVGYARTPAVALDPPEGGPSLLVDRIRMHLSGVLRSRMPGDEGAFAAALLTGDRSGVSQVATQHLRDSNLYHLLSISGLHMVLLTGVVFTSLRVGLALVPAVALRVPGKKIAAFAALVTGAMYLALSGWNVATERAFIMVAVVLGGVLVDRRALTFRSVALAGLLILVLEPESLVEAGFQMSFAATIALIAAFNSLRDLPGWLWRPPRWTHAALATLLSSFVAGAATAPFSAAHFNQVAEYGLLANMLAVPLMGAVIMPAAVAAICLAPLGLEILALEPMRLGIAWTLWVAEWVAGLDGAVWPVVTPQPVVLPLMTIGALWVMLWRSRARWVGLVPVLAAFAFWTQAERPALLIAESGGLIGVLGPEGRALSKPGGEGFVALSWLENDGDSSNQEAAFARPGLAGAPGAQMAEVSGETFTLVTGRGWKDRIAPACAAGWVVVPQQVEDAPQGCRLIDRDRLAETGAIAVYPDADGPRMVDARAAAGARPWTE